MKKTRRRSNRKGVHATGPRLAHRRRSSVRRLFTERLEDRRLLTGMGETGYSPYHNYIVPEDVNTDFYLSPRDALIVISDLNNNGSRELASDAEETTGTGRVDTDGDGFLSPRDALIVIDALNDAEGNGPVKVVALTLELQDADGNPLPGNRVMSGEDFRVQMGVRDLRPSGTGVFAAYMDIDYSSQLLQGSTLVDVIPDYATPPDELTEMFTLGGTDPSAFTGSGDNGQDLFETFWVRSDDYDQGNPYANPWRWFDTTASALDSEDGEFTEDEFDEMGAFLAGLSDDPGFGNDLIPMMYGTLTADLQYDYPGLVTFSGDFADRVPQSDIVFANDPFGDPVAFEAIEFNSVTVEIYKPLYARDVEVTTAEDTLTVVAIDAELDSESTGTLSIQSFTQPAQGGTVSLVADELVYTPDEAYNNDGGSPDTFTYTVTDGLGNEETATVTVTVTAVNDDPIANPDTETVAEDGGPYLFDVLDNDLPGRPAATDEAGQAKILTSVGVAGFTLQGGTVEIDGNQAKYTPPTDFFGTDSFNYVMEDELGASDSSTVTITVTNTNDDPVPVDDEFGVDPLILEDLGGAPFIELDVLANDESGVDPPGEISSYTLTGVGDELNGTGDAIVNAGVTQEGGVVSIVGNVVRYTPATDFFGTDTFVYEMNDAGLIGFATVTVQIEPVNDAPTADDAFLEAEEREAGDPPTELDVITGLTTAGPPNEAALLGDEVFVNEILSGPSSGTLVILPGDKLLSYTPNVGFEGTDSFTYTVRDVDGLVSDVATAEVLVEPLTLPRARDDRDLDVVEDTPTELDVLANDVINPGATLEGFIITVQPTNGTASIVGDTILYTPDDDYFGADSFVYQIDDDFLGSLPDDATVTINVTPVNDPPVADDDSYTFDEDETQLLPVLDNDDAGADNETEGISINAFVTPPQFGTLTIVSGGQQFEYVPDANFYGTDTFTYTIIDDLGDVSQTAATVSLTVENVNDTPTASSKSYTVDEDSNGATDAANQLDVTLGDVPGTPGLYSDDDGDSITLVAAGLDNGTFQDGITQQGGTVAIVAGEVQYTPPAEYFGSDQFTYIIEDSQGARDSATINITVTEVNDDPTVQDEMLMALKDFSDQELDVLANDSITPDEGTGESLTIKELVGQDASGVLDTPHGTAQISADGLRVIYTPDAGFESNGTVFDTFGYVVQDGRGGEATGTAEVDVINAVPTDISGVVYIDADGDGMQHPDELTLGGVEVRLRGTDINGTNVDITTTTDANGVFRLNGILPTSTESTSGYMLTADTPQYLEDGRETIIDTFADEDYDPGTAQDDMFTGIDLGVWGADDRAASNYAFGESGLASSYIKLTQYLASTRNGLMLATDGLGDTFWYAAIEGWEGVESLEFAFESIPAPGSTDNSGLARATLTVNGQTRTINYYTHFDFAGDPRDGGVVVFLKGTAEELGFDLSYVNGQMGAEGEMSIEGQDLELLAAAQAGQYRDGVDAVFGSGDWA